MAAESPQTKQNHVRVDPTFHYFLVPLLMGLFVWFLVHAVRRPGTEAFAVMLLSLASLLTVFKARMYALKVQDRLIRLEEKLRLAALLAPAEQGDCAGLSETQLIALRFASDNELPALARRAARENLTAKEIKDAIQNWRADYFRV